MYMSTTILVLTQDSREAGDFPRIPHLVVEASQVDVLEVVEGVLLRMSIRCDRFILFISIS
jgi:hypothetical protein